MSFALGGSGDDVVAPRPLGAAENVLGNLDVLTLIMSRLVNTLGIVTSNVVTRTPPKRLKRDEITIECEAQKWRGVKCAFRPRPDDHVAIRGPGNLLRWFTVISVETRPEVGYVATCIDADQLNVETLALKITRDFVRALRPIIALAGTCRMVRSTVLEWWCRTKLAQVWGGSLAAYIYERLAYGIDDITAAVNSIEWLRQKKGPNRVPDLGFLPLLNSVCTLAVWGFHNSTEDATKIKSAVRFPEAYDAALTQLWHQNSEIRDAVRPWVIALDYWRVSAKGGPGTFGQSQYQLGRAALAAPPAVLSKIFLAMLGTALSRAKTDDQLGHRLAVDDMLKYFNKKTMPLVAYGGLHTLTSTAYKYALVVIEELEKTGIKQPKLLGTRLGHTCVPVHLWLCTAIGQVPAETIDGWFSRANNIGFRMLVPQDSTAREINTLLMAHWWQPGIRSLLPRFARFTNIVNDLFRKAARTATPPNEEPPLFTVALAFGMLLTPHAMSTLPDGKLAEYRTVYKEFNVRYGGWKKENGDQPFPVKAARELSLFKWNREPPSYLPPIPGWTVKKNRPPASETANVSGKKSRFPASEETDSSGKKSRFPASEEEPSRKRRNDASGPKGKKKARAPSEAGPAE